MRDELALQKARLRFRVIVESGVPDPINQFLIGEGLASPSYRAIEIKHEAVASSGVQTRYSRTDYRPDEPYFCENRTYTPEAEALELPYPMPTGQGGIGDYPF